MGDPVISISVTGYEDSVKEDSGATVVYLVKVEAITDAHTKTVYFLRKRYSEFARLNVALKERYPRKYRPRLPPHPH